MYTKYNATKHVNLVFGEDNHRHLVMNWITAALKVLTVKNYGTFDLSVVITVKYKGHLTTWWLSQLEYYSLLYDIFVV